MHFFDLPFEIRLMIFSELLIVKPYVVLRYQVHDRALVLYHWRHTRKIYLGILCVNKQSYRECSPLLYSKNTFEFPYYTTFSPSHLLQQAQASAETLAVHDDLPLIIPFVTQVRAQASLIRHARIHCPYRFGQGEPRPGFVDGIIALRENCPNLASLEFALQLSCGNDGWAIPPLTERGLDALDSLFRTLRQLRDIIIKLYIHEYQQTEPELDGPWFEAMLQGFEGKGWKVEFAREYSCERCSRWFESQPELCQHLYDRACVVEVEPDSDDEVCQFQLYD
jgi:hypothetical protein